MHRLLLPSPVGPLLAEYHSDALLSLRFWPQGEHPPAGTRDEPGPADPLGRQIQRELREYFSGQRQRFSLPLEPTGTAFQQRVWEALCAIPPGETRSYAAVAEAVERPRAFRAVGQANRRNPIPIIIPCHRVVPASGGVGGYAGQTRGDGAARKRWLLRHEGGLAV